MQNLGAFVAGRTRDQHIVAFGRVSHQICCLHPADLNAIKSHVEIDITVQDQAIVADDLYISGLCGVHHPGRLGGIVR